MINYDQFKSLVESNQRNTLWHATGLTNANSILHYNRFHLSEPVTDTDIKLNNGYSYFLSTSFELDNEFAHAMYANDHDLATFLALRGDKLSRNYTLKEVDFFHYGDNREKEIRVLTNDSVINQAQSYIKYAIVSGYEEHKEEVSDSLGSRLTVYFFDRDKTSEDDIYDLNLSVAEVL